MHTHFPPFLVFQHNYCCQKVDTFFISKKQLVVTGGLRNIDCGENILPPCVSFLAAAFENTVFPPSWDPRRQKIFSPQSIAGHR